ncbi:MAG TPA: hypothetical protein VEC37_12850 [Bacillota bacterium]|nr:hypothetical protein [Bacillota bacterium]
MARFFRLLLTIFLLLSVSRSVLAMGVNDFVAVADSSAAAVYNPAGLIGLDGKQLLLEHRVTHRDVAVGWDDLAVYSAADERGTGALFYAYSQDWVGLSQYNRIKSLGYAYGWQPTDNLAIGLSAKYNRRGIYNNSSGVMVKQTTLSNEFLMDCGLLYAPMENWTIGFTYYNLGHDNSDQLNKSLAVLGVAYETNKITAALEVYDLLNEGGAIFEGSLIRTGLKYNITSNVAFHGVLENSTSDWDYTGKMLVVELKRNSLNFDISWYRAEGKYVYDDTVQAGLGFTF